MHNRLIDVIKSKYFKMLCCILLLTTVLMLAFRVPTRLVARDINQNSDFPVGILTRSNEADWSGFAAKHGFGMTSYYVTDTDGSILRFDVSSWPNSLTGKQCVDFIVCTNYDYSVYGFSVGDSLSDAEEALRRHGFWKTTNSGELGFQYRKFGIIISCWADVKNGKIEEITIQVLGIDILVH